MRKPIDQYRTVQVQTSSPGQVALLLFDAAVGCLSRAELALAENRLDLASARLIWAQNIVLELLSLLDVERGGALATSLRELYVYLYRTLVQANLTKDAEAVRVARSLLNTLRNAWRTALATAPSAPSDRSGGSDGVAA